MAGWDNIPKTALGTGGREFESRRPDHLKALRQQWGHPPNSKLTSNQAIEAIYENGVLRPLRELDLEEHQRVSLRIDEDAGGVSIDDFLDHAHMAASMPEVILEPLETAANRKWLAFAEIPPLTGLRAVSRTFYRMDSYPSQPSKIFSIPPPLGPVHLLPNSPHPVLHNIIG